MIKTNELLNNELNKLDNYLETINNKPIKELQDKLYNYKEDLIDQVKVSHDIDNTLQEIYSELECLDSYNSVCMDRIKKIIK